VDNERFQNVYGKRDQHKSTQQGGLELSLDNANLMNELDYQAIHKYELLYVKPILH